MTTTLMYCDIPGLPPPVRGKVRDNFVVGDQLLIVATDRISAYDVIMPTAIPGKGRVLTALSGFWFDRLRHIVPSHIVTTDSNGIGIALKAAGAKYTPKLAELLSDRAMLVHKAAVYPVECVVRGYMAGSLWKEYQEEGGEAGPVEIHGNWLPGGLLESQRLEKPVFTPATKAEAGHDENIGLAEVQQIVGADVAARLRSVSLKLYSAARAHAESVGILLADTKFEFGVHNDSLILVDEALTPDSSRFWPAAGYAAGHAQPSYDKQYLRDWLTASGWNKEPPAPDLPAEVVAQTAAKYTQAMQMLRNG